VHAVNSDSSEGGVSVADWDADGVEPALHRARGLQVQCVDKILDIRKLAIWWRTAVGIA
jgi:hypothetical protein